MNLATQKRFWSRVSKIGFIHPTYGQCWEWTGNLCVGYGGISINSQYCYAHRVSWEIENGPIPPGLQVLHHCDNRKCVKPAHLFLGTKKDNYIDSKTKDRHSRGERSGQSKLTDKQVLEIRRRYRPGDRKASLSVLAREFGVHPPAIYKIVKRIHWRHI